MNFEKYVSMLENEILFFANSRLFKDGFEGLGTTPNRENLVKKMNFSKNHVDIWKERFFINCWHMNPKESMAMWDIYATNNNGIAIMSSYENLYSCLENNADNDFYIGPVAYVDFENDKIDIDSPVVRHFLKRDFFRHEQELRAVYINLKYKDGRNSLTPESGNNGIKIKIKLEELVDKVVISPKADNWYFELVKSITNRYNFKFSIEKSKIEFMPNMNY